MFRSLRSLLLPAMAGLAMLGAQPVRGNNIQVTATPVLTGNTGTTVQVQFGLSWENSWRTSSAPANWDAAWVFVKYRDAAGVWRHANLNSTGHVAPSGSQIDVGLLTPGTAFNASTNPAVGAFIYRNANGSGTFSLTNVQLQWNYSAAGITFTDIAQVQVYAIETVYVPQGAFAAGSGGTEVNAFTRTTINTAVANTVPAGTGSLGGQAGGYPTGQTAPVATWPNGFSAFYCMKYEVSQQGYVDFLNTLTYTQQATRTTNAPNSVAGTGALVTGNTNRNGIDIQTPGVASTTPALYACNLNGNTTYSEAADGQFIACNFLSWGDLSAYLDWSGLRPMTELEFEKVCRGTIAPVANEYPWGTTTVTGADNITNGGSNNESCATVGANAIYNNSANVQSPMRVGVFATSTSTRITAGASYYGVMELGGDLWERPVTIGNANGRAYTGAHGNGALTTAGQPDGSTWPAPTTADGVGLRGGALSQGSTTLRISERNLAAFTAFTRNLDVGGRGVRTQ